MFTSLLYQKRSTLTLYSGLVFVRGLNHFPISGHVAWIRTVRSLLAGRQISKYHHCKHKKKHDNAITIYHRKWRLPIYKDVYSYLPGPVYTTAHPFVYLSKLARIRHELACMARTALKLTFKWIKIFSLYKDSSLLSLFPAFWNQNWESIRTGTR